MVVTTVSIEITGNKNKHIVTDEIMYIRQLFFSYVTFLSSKLINTVHMTFADIVFATLVGTLTEPFIISLHTMTELPIILFKYLIFSDIHVLGFQL